MTTEEMFDAAQVKGEGYRLLSECYYPPKGGLDGLIADLAEWLIPVCPETAPHIQSMQEEGPLETDRISDYARLFVGPFATPAPPYGSVYLDPGNRVMGSSAAHVRDLYLEMGLDISDECTEAPDHISVELEFMHFLCIREAEAASRDEGEAALYYSRKQKEFLEGSLAWIQEFTDRVRAHAATEFYRGLAECTRAFIADQLAEIRSQETEVRSQARGSTEQSKGSSPLMAEARRGWQD